MLSSPPQFAEHSVQTDRVGFEPTRRNYRLRALQARALDLSATCPGPQIPQMNADWRRCGRGKVSGGEGETQECREESRGC